MAMPMAMTDAQLWAAVDERAAINKRIGETSRPIRSLEPECRALYEADSARFWSLDAAISAELARRDGPVKGEGRTLRPLKDGLFAVISDGPKRRRGYGMLNPSERLVAGKAVVA